MMWKKVLWGLFCGVMLPVLAPQAATDRMVAVVNDQVITLSQLEDRTQLNLRQSGLENPTDAQRDAVKRRTLSTLIDEELQRQFAQNARISVSRADIEKGRQAAIQNIGEDGWKKITHDLEKAANDKLAAEVLWQNILAREIRPRINVGTVEVDRLIEELAKNRQVLEREISMILLNPAEGNADKEQFEKLKALRERVQKGADFGEEARAYSDDKSAVNGGRLGWFASGELNPELEDALDKMQPGSVSEPIRTPLGWHLIKLENVRTTKPVDTTPVTVYDLYLLVAPTVDSSDTKVIQEAEKDFSKTIKSLKRPEDVRASFSDQKFTEKFRDSKPLGWVLPSDLQPELQKAVETAKVGNWTNQVAFGNSKARIYLAESKKSLPRNLDSYRQKVMDNLISSRMELNARRFMRELRQKAFVDVRL